MIATLTTVAAFSQRQMESLDRGVVAVRDRDGKVFVSWRLSGTEQADLAFNVYRSVNGKAEKLNKQPVINVTHFTDAFSDTTKDISYFVKTIAKGKETAASKSFHLKAGTQPHFCSPVTVKIVYHELCIVGTFANIFPKVNGP